MFVMGPWGPLGPSSPSKRRRPAGGRRANGARTTGGRRASSSEAPSINAHFIDDPPLLTRGSRYPRVGWASKIKFKHVGSMIGGRILVRDVFHFTQVAETSSLPFLFCACIVLGGQFRARLHILKPCANKTNRYTRARPGHGTSQQQNKAMACLQFQQWAPCMPAEPVCCQHNVQAQAPAHATAHMLTTAKASVKLAAGRIGLNMQFCICYYDWFYTVCLCESLQTR